MMLNRSCIQASVGRTASTSAAFRPCSAVPSRRMIVPKAAGNTQESGFVADILKLAKKIQGSLPIIGLVSRLAAPEGGFDELAYPEYCRSVFDTSTPSMSVAMQELEKKHGKLAASRWVLLVLWMTNTGLGLVAAKDILAAARRLRVTQDIEVEIERFEGARFTTLKKYDMMAPPAARPQDKAVVAVDALCTLCLGLKDGVAPAEDDVPRVLEVVLGSVTGVTREMVQESLQGRSQRAMAYK